MYVKPSTPYCGFGRRAGGNEMFVPSSAAHVLVSAPTETGKSRRLLAPAATLWGGPAVVVSSKDDLMQYVMERRWGPKALLDLRPLKSPVYPEGVVPNIYDPTVTIDSPYEALTVAETIMQMSTVGLGSGADQVSDGGVWESQAAGPLAAFLFAASPEGNGKGMDWVLTAVDNIDPENSTQPGWVQAAALCHQYPTLAMGMARIMEMDPRQRDSVAITMRKAITPWLRTSLLDREGFEPFTPDFLDDPQATLFILAPADGTVAGSAVTLLDSLVRRWREKTSTRETMHRLLMVIDELPNTAPIPNLRRIVGEGRGLGINLMVAVQASSQLDTVYGAVYANELRDIFPASVIMFGAREEELLTAAEHWSGLTNRRPQGFGQNDGGKNLNNDLGATLRWQELLPPTREHARLLIRGGVGTCVEIPDWSVFLQFYDQTTQAILARAHGRDGSAGAVEQGGFAAWCGVRGWIATVRRDPELARRINLLFDVMHTRTEPPLNSAAAAAAMSARGGSAVSAAVLEQLRLGYRGDALDAQLSIVADFFGVPSVYLTETRVRTGIDAQLHLVRLMREMGDRGPAPDLSVVGGTEVGL